MSFKRSIVSLGFLAIALAAPAARAQTCKVNADCSKGFFCVLVPSTPPSEPVSAPPACKSGTVCPVTDPAPTAKVAPAPAPEPAGYCQEASCTADADCGTGMLCHTETYSACSGGTAYACPANAKCAPPTPVDPVCTETKVSTCMYKWQLPCNADNDCGAGFTCKPAGGVCSGGSGTGVATSGTATGHAGSTTAGTGSGSAPSASTTTVAPVPPDTTCSPPTFPGYCEAKATTCTVDTDCPASWTCVETPTRGGPVGIAVGEPTPAGTGGATGSTGANPSSTTTPPPSGTPPATVTKACMAPGGIYSAQDANSSPTTTIGSGAGTGGAAGSVPPKAGNPGASMTDSASGSAPPAAGCAVGGSSSGSPFALLLLGALGLVVTRRKR